MRSLILPLLGGTITPEEIMARIPADVDKVYMETILPGKMKWNLNSIQQFSVVGDLVTMLRTVLAVCGKEYV